MGKKLQKSHTQPEKFSRLTKKDCDELAQSLVERGLAPSEILEGTFHRENQNRSTYMREGLRP